MRFLSISVFETALGGRPLVVDQPASDISKIFTELGAIVVQEIAKLNKIERNSVRYDPEKNHVVVTLREKETSTFFLDPKIIRQNDTSVKTIDEWTQTSPSFHILPKFMTFTDSNPFTEENPLVYEIDSLQPLGNYAIQIRWKDQFNQIATFDLLASLPRMLSERKTFV